MHVRRRPAHLRAKCVAEGKKMQPRRWGEERAAGAAVCAALWAAAIEAEGEGSKTLRGWGRIKAATCVEVLRAPSTCV